MNQPYPPGGQYPPQPDQPYAQPGQPYAQPGQQYAQPGQQQYAQGQYPPQAGQPAGGLPPGNHNPRALQGLGPKGQQLLQSVTLLPNESLQYAIMADGYFIGTHPIQKLIASIVAMLTTLTGGHLRIFLIVSNQRILLLQSRQQWCGWTRVKGVNAIALGSLAEAGSGKETQFCCIHSRFVHIETKTQRHQMVIKKLGDSDLQEFVSNLSAVLVANVQARTAT